MPNRTRKVFETGGATLESLKEITGELDALLADITAKQASLIALSESMGHSVQTGVWLESRARRVQEVTNKLLNAA